MNVSVDFVTLKSHVWRTSFYIFLTVEPLETLIEGSLMDKRRKVKVRRSEPEDTDRDLSNRVQVAFGIEILIKNCENKKMQ